MSRIIDELNKIAEKHDWDDFSDAAYNCNYGHTIMSFVQEVDEKRIIENLEERVALLEGKIAKLRGKL